MAGELEVSSWPDRLAFLYRVTPTTTLNGAVLTISLDLDDAYSQVLSKGMGKALAAADGSGFAFISDPLPASLVADAAQGKVTARYEVGQLAAGVTKELSLIIYPAGRDCQGALERAVESESAPLSVTAQQTQPSNNALGVSYDSTWGWYRVALRNDGPGDYSESANNRIERVRLTINNPTSHTQEARFNFAKDGNVTCVTGISSMLRDANGHPIGIPVQISKDWHTSSSHPRYQGPWLHGLSMIDVPGNASLEVEYTSVNALWGGVPAAAHAQLSLVGYAVNQQWDQSSMGSWGESITYDPDVNLNRSMIDDVRPLMVNGTSNSSPNQKWGWTNNVGGGDFLVYYDESGNKQWNSRMRSRYVRYCPGFDRGDICGLQPGFKNRDGSHRIAKSQR